MIGRHQAGGAMLLFDMMVQVTVGTVFALRDREEIVAAPKPTETRAFRDSLLYSVFIYVPSAIFFFYVWPGWNSMYLLDIETNRIYGGWYAFVDCALLFGCLILGFKLTASWLKKDIPCRTLWLRLAAGWAVIFVVLFVWQWGRSFAVTTYSDFVSRDWPRFDLRWGEPDSFFGRPIMWWLSAWCLLDFVPLGVIYVRGRKQAARRAASVELRPAARSAGA